MTTLDRHTGPRRFGTPPHTAREWLELFAQECEQGRRASLNPLERRRLKGMAQAYRIAADLVLKSGCVGKGPNHVHIDGTCPDEYAGEVVDFSGSGEVTIDRVTYSGKVEAMSDYRHVHYCLYSYIKGYFRPKLVEGPLADASVDVEGGGVYLTDGAGRVEFTDPRIEVFLTIRKKGFQEIRKVPSLAADMGDEKTVGVSRHSRHGAKP